MEQYICKLLHKSKRDITHRRSPGTAIFAGFKENNDKGTENAELWKMRRHILLSHILDYEKSDRVNRGLQLIAVTSEIYFK